MQPRSSYRVLIGATVLTVGAALATEARAADDFWSSQRPGTVISVGQGTYTIPAIPVSAPYSLTGNDTRTPAPGFWAQQGQNQISVGNGRITVPSLR